MERMFYNASAFNQDINTKEFDDNGGKYFDDNGEIYIAWNVGNVTDMYYMFGNATAFNQDLSSWDVGNVTDYRDFDKNTPNWFKPKPNFN